MKRAFTLIELVLTLTILAILTNLAVSITNNKLRDARAKMAKEEIFSLQNAVQSYYDDVGFLPMARGNVATFVDLAVRPDDLLEYAVRVASAENLRGGMVDEDVAVGCGWRGPYVRWPLRDAWGNVVATPDEAGFARLAGAGTNTDVKAGMEIVYYRDLGEKGTDEECRWEPLAKIGAGSLTFRREDAVRMGLDVACDELEEVKVCCYAPLGGAITGAVAKIESGRQFVKFNFPCGRVALRAHAGGKSSMVVSMRLISGDNEVVYAR